MIPVVPTQSSCDHCMAPSLQPLPTASPVQSSISPELFGDAVMVVEFLNTFGKLFNIEEVIRGGITFGM